MEKIKVSLPIVVEGRYDKSTLSGFVDATIITTDGFSIFNNKEKQLLVRRLCADGAIILTDSDGGGKQIRSFLSGIVRSDKIYNLYIPKISGKEKRKQRESRKNKQKQRNNFKKLINKRNAVQSYNLEIWK